MNNVDRTLQERMERMGRRLDNTGGPPDDPDMRERVEKLEKLVEKAVERVVNIERDVAVVRSNYATGKDVSDAKSTIILWVVGAIFLVQLLPMVKDFIRPGTTPAAATAPQASSDAPVAPTK